MKCTIVLTLVYYAIMASAAKTILLSNDDGWASTYIRAAYRYLKDQDTVENSMFLLPRLLKLTENLVTLKRVHLLGTMKKTTKISGISMVLLPRVFRSLWTICFLRSLTMLHPIWWLLDLTRVLI